MADQQKNSKEKAAPIPPKFSIQVNITDSKLGESNITCVIEARAFKNDIPLKLERIVLKRGTQTVAQDDTDDTGTCVLALTVPLSEQGQLVAFRLQLSSHKTEEIVTIQLPKKSFREGEDPDRARLRYYTVSNTGEVNLSLRVVQEKGYAVKDTKIAIEHRCIQYTLKVNDETGCAYFKAPFLLEPGQAEEIFLIVNGIIQECPIHVYRPRVKLTSFDIFILFIKRISFIGLFLATGVSLLLSILSLVMIFSRSFKERLESNDGAGDIIWVIILTLCFVAPFLLSINIIWFWVRLNLSRAFEFIKERTVYRKTRTAKDSNWEKLAEMIEKMLSSHAKNSNTSNQTTGTGSSLGHTGGLMGTIKVIILSLLSDIGFDWFGKLIAKGVHHT